MYAKTLIAFIVLVSAAGVGTVFLQKQLSVQIAEDASEKFQAGNYLASLVGYSSVKDRAIKQAVPAVEQKIEQSKELLIAEVNFQKARRAADEGNWLEAKALLAGDASMINTSFTYYQDAIDLFLEASDKVKALEQKIDAELKQLKVEAGEEKKKREHAETTIAETRAELTTTIAEKTKTEEVLRGEIQEKTGEALKAKAEAEAERLGKFKNELGVYISMLMKGNAYIADALTEINRAKDTTALLFVGQGKALFDEVSIRGQDILEERTPENFKEYTLVFYIGKEDGAEFQALMNEITERRNAATGILRELQNFVR